MADLGGGVAPLRATPVDWRRVGYVRAGVAGGAWAGLLEGRVGLPAGEGAQRLLARARHARGSRRSGLRHAPGGPPGESGSVMVGRGPPRLDRIAGGRRRRILRP